ncbi:DUF397 domain-containing protein [Streptomyces acidiscabies]|uniref:Regulatory protein n=1 Tax=Streptomyces acidiscabies TaxID=42234 RepID=A0A0L0KP12_9ACTN|nr:DUF397 domain-containing protein [Streptomyces acidiscabies]KND39581.1 regulatory protein [Streptomyces acidiscabies]
MKPDTQSAAAALKWVKSSYSGHQDNCVEIAALPHGNHALRDSKIPTGPNLTFPRSTWADFLRSI